MSAATGWKRVAYELVCFAASQGLSLKRLPGASRALGALLWTVLGKRRRLAIRTIAERLELPEAEARHIARESFRHSAQSFLEILVNRQADARFLADRLVLSPASRANLAMVEASDRPILFTSAHFGGWEISVGTMDLHFPGRPCATVVRRPKDAALAELMLRLRTRPAAAMIEHRGAVRPILKLFRTKPKGGVAAFLVDHNCSRDEAIFLPFLGRLAAVNKGPAVLAARASALVVPGFVRRIGAPQDTRYEWVVGTPLDPNDLPGDSDDKIAAIARFYTEAVERIVRENPEQWYWMHRRWKTRPEGEERGGG